MFEQTSDTLNNRIKLFEVVNQMFNSKGTVIESFNLNYQLSVSALIRKVQHTQAKIHK